MDYIFNLTSEDLSYLGSRMGLEHTSINFVKSFKNLENAQKFAQKDYNKQSDSKEIINWRKDGRNKWTSDDLRFVMYEIEKVKLL